MSDTVSADAGLVSAKPIPMRKDQSKNQDHYIAIINYSNIRKLDKVNYMFAEDSKKTV